MVNIVFAVLGILGSPLDSQSFSFDADKTLLNLLKTLNLLNKSGSQNNVRIVSKDKNIKRILKVDPK